MREHTPFLIRRAEPADGPAVLACLREAFAPYEAEYTAGAFADTVLSATTLKQRMASKTVLVADAPDGSILGTIGFSAREEEGHIRGMAVRSDAQGSGVAAELLAAAESSLRALGCRRVSLDTTEPLLRAIAFYQKHGYAPTGHQQDFFGMTLLELAKSLVP